MKNKPISEGYKLFALTDKQGYVLNFTPDGRISTKTNGQQEYLVDGTSKIKSMIEFLVTTAHDQH
jgi:hypothetical protein